MQTGANTNYTAPVGMRTALNESETWVGVSGTLAIFPLRTGT